MEEKELTIEQLKRIAEIVLDKDKFREIIEESLISIGEKKKKQHLTEIKELI